MDFALRPVSEVDAEALQGLYVAAPATFTRLTGCPVRPGQAERDIAQAQGMPGRYQFGAVVDGELAGMIDVKLLDETGRQEPRQAHVGLLLFPDLSAQADLAALALHVLTRWLGSSLGVCRIEASVPAADAEQIAFWQAQGYELTGESYRRQLEQYAPRFLVLARDLSSSSKEGLANVD